MSIKLPEELRIGHQNYKIRSERRSWITDSDKYGHCDDVNSEIVVVTERLQTNQVVNTFVHEVLHALFREYKLDNEEEERIVTCLANGLVQLSIDNPDFVNVLRKVK